MSKWELAVSKQHKTSSRRRIPSVREATCTIDKRSVSEDEGGSIG